MTLEPAFSARTPSPVLLDLAHLAVDHLRRADDGWHALLIFGLQRHRLFFAQQPTATGFYRVVLPFDGDFAQRLRAADSFWRACTGRPTVSPTPAIVGQKRKRIVLMLRAFDGHAAGESYRRIAEGLYGLTRLDGESWKTHDLRSKVIRLVRGGIALVKRGYRALLRLGQRGR